MNIEFSSICIVSTIETAQINQIRIETTAITNNFTETLEKGNLFGKNLQLYKNSEFTNIPAGTAKSAFSKLLTLSQLYQKPIDAGTIVVGNDPNNPPNLPPNRSIAMVAAMAIKAAKNAAPNEVSVICSPVCCSSITKKIVNLLHMCHYLSRRNNTNDNIYFATPPKLWRI